MEATAEECAHEVIEVVPTIMRAMRAEFRSHRGSDLSVPQYRAMIFIRRNPGSSLSDVADHLGITPPSTSKLVDGLVVRGLVERRTSLNDRRYITLALTGQGSELLEISFEETQAAFAQRLACLSPEERLIIARSMRLLRPVFSPAEKKELVRER